MKRHKLSNLDMVEMELDDFDEELEDLQSIVANPESMGIWISQTINSIPMAILLNKDKQKISYYLQLLGDLVRTQFKLAMNPGSPINSSIGGKTLTINRSASTSYTGYDTWLSGFYAAMIARDINSIEFLRTVPLELLRSANIQGTEFDYFFVDFMKGLFDNKADIGELLLKAMEASDLKLLPKRKHDYVLYLKVPELMLYKCLFSSDPKGFNEELVKALEKHKHFWSRDKFAYNAEGWISYPGLAASALAHDSRGFEIEIESDYLPLWLAKGEFTSK